MYKLEGIIKVVINNKVIYLNNTNYNDIGTLSKNEITSPKCNGNDSKLSKGLAKIPGGNPNGVEIREHEL